MVPAVYYAYLAIKNKQVALPNSAYWLLAFVVVALLSLVVNFELLPKPSKNFGRLKYYLFGVSGIFVLRVWLVEANDRVKRILTNTFLLSIVVAGVYAIYQFASGMARVKSLTDTMRYGYGSAMLLLTLLSALFHRERIKLWFNPHLGLVAFIIGFTGMYLTYTRGGLLAFIFGLPFVIYFYKPKLGLIIGALALILVGSVGTYYQFGSAKMPSRFLLNKNNKSDYIRRSQWDAAVIAIKERPVIGWGLSNFHSQLNRIKIENDLEAKWYNDAHSHNLFLETAAGTGFIGLFLFIAWLLTWAIELFKKGGLQCALAIPFGVAFTVGSQFEVTFDANNASMIFFMYALSMASVHSKVRI